MAARDLNRFVQILAELAPDAAEAGVDGAGEAWTPPRAESLLAPYWAEYGELLVDADARSATRLLIERAEPERWRVRQILSDPEANHDHALVFELDLAASRQAGRLVLVLRELEDG
jgi:hypothetical protein